MSLNFSGVEWHAKTLRSWQLAILRFAVTLDNADRLAVMAIAREIDRLGPHHDSEPDFSFFAGPVQSYAPLFSGPMNLPLRSCVNISRELMMIVSSACSRQQLRPTSPKCRRSANLSNATTACGEGFPRGATIRSNARLCRPHRDAVRTHVPPLDARSIKCFSRHFGPGPRM